MPFSSETNPVDFGWRVPMRQPAVRTVFPRDETELDGQTLCPQDRIKALRIGSTFYIRLTDLCLAV